METNEMYRGLSSSYHLYTHLKVMLCLYTVHVKANPHLEANSVKTVRGGGSSGGMIGALRELENGIAVACLRGGRPGPLTSWLCGMCVGGGAR